jgi:hypothetical protein
VLRRAASSRFDKSTLGVTKDYRIGFSRACSVDSVDFLPRFVFELLLEVNIALPPTSPGTAMVSSAALAVSASSNLAVGAP